MEDQLFQYRHLLPPSSILAPLKSHTKGSAIDELFNHVGLLGQLDRLHDLKAAVIRREAEGCTGLGHGVAVAHGKCASLSDLYLFLGLSPSGVDYGAYDGEPVHLLFIAANPPGMQRVYLEIIAALMRSLIVPEFRERLLRCETHIVREVLRQALRLDHQCYPLSA